MVRVRLIHWNAQEAEDCIRVLEAAHCRVEYSEFSPKVLTSLSRDAPDAIVIDLNRMPSQGRDLGVNLRMKKATRHIPLIFVGGERDKVARIREMLGDAVYTTWHGIADVLMEAIENQPETPVVPESVFAAYASTPLIKKLGIKPGSSVALVDAPDGFESRLGELPDSVTIHRNPRDRCDTTLWFVTSRENLERQIEAMFPAAETGGLWILWPKKASGVRCDVSQTVVREVGLGAGLVDFKISSMDKTWSGLRFTQRRSDYSDSS